MKRMFIIAGLFAFAFIGNMALAQSLSPVNINTADIKQLSTLKGIGPKKAAAIVQYRHKKGTFHSVNDLMHIRGIGKSFLQRLLKRNTGRIVVKVLSRQ